MTWTGLPLYGYFSTLPSHIFNTGRGRMGEESSLGDKRYQIAAAAGDPATLRCCF